MIIRAQRLRPMRLRPVPALTSPYIRHHQSQHASDAEIPPPIPFVPDVQTFLSLIGRGLSKHVSKIPTWKALFTLTSTDLRELGVYPARDRKYLLQWRRRFREGRYGIGGDLQEVVDGVAELRVVRHLVPPDPERIATATTPPGTRKIVANVPRGSRPPREPLSEAKSVKYMKVISPYKINGPNIQLLKGTRGSGATLTAKEGLWEVKRGHKIDGGERRQAEVKAKRRAEEKKTTRA